MRHLYEMSDSCHFGIRSKGITYCSEPTRPGVWTECSHAFGVVVDSCDGCDGFTNKFEHRFFTDPREFHTESPGHLPGVYSRNKRATGRLAHDS